MIKILSIVVGVATLAFLAGVFNEQLCDMVSGFVGLLIKEKWAGADSKFILECIIFYSLAGIIIIFIRRAIIIFSKTDWKKVIHK